MKNGNGHGDHKGSAGRIPMAAGIEWLKAQHAQIEKKLAAAEAEASRLKPIAATLKGTIDALGGKKTVTTTSTAPAAVHSNGENGAGKLRRQPPYAAIRMMDALKQILAGGEPVHQDELVRQVFRIGDNAEFLRAKSSVSARLSKGAKKGLWKAVGNGRYTIANGAMQS